MTFGWSFPIISIMRHFPASFLAAALLLGAALPAWADPTAQEQYWLELLNRARRDPAAELSRMVNFSSPGTFAVPSSSDPGIAAALAYYGTNAPALIAQWATLTAAAPLAWNETLRGSAASYSQMMVTSDQQSHLLGTTATDVPTAVEERILGGGYTSQYLDLGETLFAAATSVWQGHSGFLIDWGDDDTNSGNGFGTGIQTPALHREVSFSRVLKEVGIGLITSGIPGSNVNATGPVVVTQHFGNSYRLNGGNVYSDAILTGVVFDDQVLADNFYTPGEGVAGALIEVYDDATSQLLFTGVTNGAGGYNIDLTGIEAGDVLRVLAPGSGLAAQVITISGFITPEADYGLPVIFTDNAYASFQLVPEPGSVLLLLALSATCLGRRRVVRS